VVPSRTRQTLVQQETNPSYNKMMKKRRTAQSINFPVTNRDVPRQESQEVLLSSSSAATNAAPKERKSANPLFWRLSHHQEEPIEEEEEHDDTGRRGHNMFRLY
jgi:hypothetical protein